MNYLRNLELIERSIDGFVVLSVFHIPNVAVFFALDWTVCAGSVVEENKLGRDAFRMIRKCTFRQRIRKIFFVGVKFKGKSFEVGRPALTLFHHYFVGLKLKLALSVPVENLSRNGAFPISLIPKSKINYAFFQTTGLRFWHIPSGTFRVNSDCLGKSATPARRSRPSSRCRGGDRWPLASDDPEAQKCSASSTSRLHSHR